MSILIRLIQSIPLLIALGVLAAMVYAVVSWRRSPNRAKEILIKLFLVLTGALCILFALASAYAALEHNQFVLEMFAALLLVSAAALAITLVCRWRFLKHHPSYRLKRTASHTVPAWKKTLDRIAEVLRAAASNGPRR